MRAAKITKQARFVSVSIEVGPVRGRRLSKGSPVWIDQSMDPTA